MNVLIGALLELTLMGLLIYTCYLLYGHWRREVTNTEKMLFVGALIVLLIYPSCSYHTSRTPPSPA